MCVYVHSGVVLYTACFAVISPACISLIHSFNNTCIPSEYRACFKCFACINVFSSVKSPKKYCFHHFHFPNEENEVGWERSVSRLKQWGLCAAEPGS